MKQNLVRFVGSFVLLPIITVSGTSVDKVVSVANSPEVVDSTVISENKFIQKLNIAGNLFSLNAKIKEDPESIVRAKKAEAIDVYFAKYEMPLYGTGMKMVEEAEKNNIDWRLLPAIAVRESTGGKHACKGATYSAFGWGSCKIDFDSHEEAIEVVARNLGGNNPNTDHFYAGKTTEEILKTYNPPSVVKNYAAQVMRIMDTIGEIHDLANATHIENA